MTASIVPDLPEPDSPTMPSTSFSYTCRSTPRTACTKPSSVENVTCRFSISSTGALERSVAGADSRMISVNSLSDLPLLRVERVTQTVAQVVHAQHREEDRHAGEQHEPRV